MVKIQVLGYGMIPGIGTVAPHKSPFDADYKLITRIMGHGSLQVRMQNPITKAFIPITSSNVKRMYKTWNDYKAPKITQSAPVLHPTTPQPVIETKVEEIKEDIKTEENSKGSNNYNQKNNKHNNNSFKPINDSENK
jgi:hypothetical protein